MVPSKLKIIDPLLILKHQQDFNLTNSWARVSSMELEN